MEASPVTSHRSPDWFFLVRAQLIHEAVQHPANSLDLLLEILVLFQIHELQISREQQMILELVG
jgi:hypothetical protein